MQFTFQCINNLDQKYFSVLSCLLRVVELTGDTTPDIRAIECSDVIVTTPEKWDGISRSWQNRTYVQVS